MGSEETVTYLGHCAIWGKTLHSPAPPDAVERYLEGNMDFLIPSVLLKTLVLYSTVAVDGIP